MAGEVLSDELSLRLYSGDASIYEIEPLAVVRPRHTQDVAEVVRYAAENQVPVHARGAGSGLIGQALGSGIVIDFSRSMRRISRIDDETVRVQPGVVHWHLNQRLAARGRMFGPDPATSRVTTMGGVVATNSTGSHWLKYGAARDWIESAEVVLADGSIVEIARHPVDGGNAKDDARRSELVRSLSDLLARNANLIAQHQPKARVNCCGYHVFDILTKGRIDIAQLLCGSEGTLAMITEMTPPHNATAATQWRRAVDVRVHGQSDGGRAGGSSIWPNRLRLDGPTPLESRSRRDTFTTTCSFPMRPRRCY